MSRLLAALDDSAATRPVVAVAQWYAELTGLDVLALHISEDGSGRTARAIADQAGVSFEIRSGDPLERLLEAAVDDDVDAVVLGARGVPAHRMPAGHVALDLIRSVDKPVIVVPPDARIPRDRSVRLLAPVNHEPASAAALCRLLEAVELPGLELVLLRVFDADHIPMFSDHAAYEPEAWASAFVQQVVPREAARARVETRVGQPANAILDVERELAADLVVLGWGRKLLGDRASIVRHLLSHATTPLVLVPATHHNRRLTPTDAEKKAGAP